MLDLDQDENEGQWFEVRIVPARYTSASAKFAANLPDDIEERDEIMSVWLLSMLSGWDLTDQGAQLPVTRANLDQLGFRIKRFMWSQCFEALLPNARRLKSSVATSGTTAASAASLTGTASSPVVNGSVSDSALS